MSTKPTVNGTVSRCLSRLYLRLTDTVTRHRLMEMPEIEREELIAQRLEEMQRIQDKRNLDQMLKAQKERSGEGDSVSKAAKRMCVSRVVSFADVLVLWYHRTACSARSYQREDSKT